MGGNVSVEMNCCANTDVRAEMPHGAASPDVAPETVTPASVDSQPKTTVAPGKASCPEEFSGISQNSARSLPTPIRATCQPAGPVNSQPAMEGQREEMVPSDGAQDGRFSAPLQVGLPNCVDLDVSPNPEDNEESDVDRERTLSHPSPAWRPDPPDSPADSFETAMEMPGPACDSPHQPEDDQEAHESDAGKETDLEGVILSVITSPSLLEPDDIIIALTAVEPNWHEKVSGEVLITAMANACPNVISQAGIDVLLTWPEMQLAVWTVEVVCMGKKRDRSEADLHGMKVAVEELVRSAFTFTDLVGGAARAGEASGSSASPAASTYSNESKASGPLLACGSTSKAAGCPPQSKRARWC